MNSAEVFWDWFDQNKDRYYDLGEIYDREMYLELQRRLRAFHPQLSFQIGGELYRSTRTLTITAQGKRDLFTKVEELVSQAPIYKKWKIHAFKPAEGYGIKVKVANIEFDPKRLRFIPMALKNHPELNAIRVYMEEYEEEKEELFRIGLNALLEACLGEKNAALHINYMDIRSYPKTADEIELVEDFVLLDDYIEYRTTQVKYN